MKLVTVAIYYDSPTAWIALNQLKSEEIQAFIENESLVQNAWELGEAAGQIRLRVEESDFDRASKILGEDSTVDLSELDKMAMESKPEDESKPIFKRFYPDEFDDGEENGKPQNRASGTGIDDGLKDADEEETLNSRELLIDRALKGSVVSVFFFPLALLVAYMLFQIFLQEEPIRPKYRKKLIQAYAFHLPLFVILLILVRFILQPM